MWQSWCPPWRLRWLFVSTTTWLSQSIPTSASTTNVRSFVSRRPLSALPSPSLHALSMLVGNGWYWLLLSSLHWPSFSYYPKLLLSYLLMFTNFGDNYELFVHGKNHKLLIHGDNLHILILSSFRYLSHVYAKEMRFLTVQNASVSDLYCCKCIFRTVGEGIFLKC